MIKTILFSALTLAVPLDSYASQSLCQQEVRNFYKIKNYRPSYKNLKTALGKANSYNSIRQLQYKWGDFYLITRDGDVVEKYGKIPEKLDTTRKTYKSLDISHVIETLGKPDKVKKDILKQEIWTCKNTESSIKIILTPNDKIEQYSGRLCSNKNSPMCTSFSHENTIMLMD